MTACQGITECLGAMLVAWGEVLHAQRDLELNARSVGADQVIFPSFFVLAY